MKKKKTGIMQKGIVLVMCLVALLSLASCGSYKEVRSVDDLEGSRIGVQLGTTGDTYASDYEGDDAGTVIERYNKGNDAVQALKQKKIDAVIIDEQPALAFVEKNKDLKILDEEFAVEDYAICISKNNTELKKKINSALAELKADGTFDSIAANYTGNDDEKGKTPYVAKNIERPNGTLVAATNAAFKPYEYYDNGKMTGFDVDMIQAVCDILGMNLKMEDMEFARSLLLCSQARQMLALPELP